MAAPICLGIDTGGTYTDAVVYCETSGILASAKALTTRHDLAVGIGEAAAGALAGIGGGGSAISLVSLSTTLATNALVENSGGRVGLVMIGFGPDDLRRDGLDDALGSDPVVFLKGGHDVYGRETPLDLTPLAPWLAEIRRTIEAVAVVGYFAVRNPAHEIQARDIVTRATGLPVTCSHQLTSRLGGPRRALTTVLNARLVPMIARLIAAAGEGLRAVGIDAPLMVVRGDGALISASEARARPIETILSGPAASLAGARHLTGLDRAVVSDIGGTTTDVAVLEDGRPRIDGEGATVGGWRTMVEAVAMYTFGLGGDSEVRLEETGLSRALRLGPRRLVPLSLLAHLHPEAVVEHLGRQLKADRPGRLDGLFAFRSGLPEGHAAGLDGSQGALYARLSGEPQPLDRLLESQGRRATLDRLVARGLAQVSGFTPSDAMHVLGRQSQWNGGAAELGAALFARRRDGSGAAIAADAHSLCEAVSRQMTRQSAEAILAALMAEEGLPPLGNAGSQFVDRALERREGLVRFSLSLDRPLVALGASAPVHYPAIAEALSADAVVPAHAGVANAVGAVVGRVRETAVAIVNSPEEGIYSVNGAGESRRFGDRDAAFALARELAARAAREAALRSGADEPLVQASETIEAPMIEGREKLVEARFTATASGRPRIGR